MQHTQKIALESCDWFITGVVGVFCIAGHAEENLDINYKKLE